MSKPVRQGVIRKRGVDAGGVSYSWLCASGPWTIKSLNAAVPVASCLYSRGMGLADQESAQPPGGRPPCRGEAGRQNRDGVVLLWRLRLGGCLGHAGQRQRRRIFAGGIGGRRRKSNQDHSLTEHRRGSRDDEEGSDSRIQTAKALGLTLGQVLEDGRHWATRFRLDKPVGSDRLRSLGADLVGSQERVSQCSLVPYAVRASFRRHHDVPPIDGRAARAGLSVCAPASRTGSGVEP